jgi:ABC-2 type transport system ATP-binding protein
MFPEEPHLYPHLTGAEYLDMVGRLRGLPERPLAEKIDGFLTLLSLREDRYVPISSYSKGMRQKVLLAAALLHNPNVICCCSYARAYASSSGRCRGMPRS